jgi:hypothetical protein
MNSQNAAILGPRPATEWSHALALAGASTAVLLLGLAINPVFLATLFVTLAGVAHAYFRPLRGFLYYLVAIQAVDFLKRLELVFGEPSPAAWFGLLLLPDLILFSVLAGVLAAGGRDASAQGKKYRTVAWFLCLYAAWYTLRAVWTQAPLVNGVGKWKLVIPYFVCFYLGERLLANTAALRSTLKVLAATVGVAALYGIWQFFFGLTSFEQSWLWGGHTSLAPETVLYGNDISRVFSFYSDPGTFGYVLACVGVLLLFSRRSFGQHWWNSWLLLGLMGAAMLATVARSAWLLVCFGGITWLWTQWQTKRARKIVLLAGLVAGLAGTGWWVISFAGNLDNPLLARAAVLGTYGSRTNGFQNLLDLGIYRSVAGQGVATMPGSFRDISGSGVEDPFVAHDYFTESLYEIGWIGVGLFLFIIVRTLVGRSPSYLGPLGPALKFLVWSVPFIAILFGGSLLLVRPVTTLLWAGAGMLCATDVDRAKGSA